MQDVLYIADRQVGKYSVIYRVEYQCACKEKCDRESVNTVLKNFFSSTKTELILGLGLPTEVDVSLIIGYVMKFNYALPYNASYLTDSYVRHDRSISPGVEVDENDEPTPDHQGVARVITRWEIYEILESVLGGSRSGKACLLRAICEASAVPFNRVHGLSSQLVHLLLTVFTST
ncbi:hypothetical protein E2986_12930 [Frieseomelitta varia]|uniref:Uncharacterized protein n=1 Tax=Frieseomelitta varia TaxID=561572 RepID=A0A833W031_9HYME|nr:hypothetical protein E2986_12930 [Frieseomelitta varia]